MIHTKATAIVVKDPDAHYFKIDVTVTQGDVVLTGFMNIDLIIMLAHSEWRLEHFLFGRIKEEIIRKTPCSILLIKDEPGKGTY